MVMLWSNIGIPWLAGGTVARLWKARILTKIAGADKCAALLLSESCIIPVIFLQ
jgi:hypothetical protein